MAGPDAICPPAGTGVTDAVVTGAVESSLNVSDPAGSWLPAVSTEFLDEHPDVADLLNPLMAALTTGKLTELNGRISVDREKTEDVARDFLESEGLL